MHPPRPMVVLAALAAAVSAAGAAGNNLVANGGFEASGPIAAWRSLGPGSAAVAGWRVTSGSAALVGSFWRANSGTNSLEVGSPGAGTLAQTIATVAGRRYRLSFAMAGNPDGPPHVKTLQVSAGRVTRRYTFDVTGRSRASMGWIAQSLDFTAAGSATVIAFSRLDGGGSAWFGPAIDDVTVTETDGDGGPPSPSPSPGAMATRAVVAPSGGSYGGLWSAAYPDKPLRVYIERRGTGIVGTTVDGSDAIPTGAIAFTGRADGDPVVVLAKCVDADARGWHGAVIEWAGHDAFHLRVANCHAADVLYTRWRR